MEAQQGAADRLAHAFIPESQRAATDVEYLKLVYRNLTGQIHGYLQYIERATFWGTGVLLGTAGYLTTNVKEVPPAGKFILVAAVFIFTGSLVFSILRAVSDLKTCARHVAKIDNVFGAFEVGRYLPQTTLYPPEWQAWGSEPWSERHL